MTPEQRLANTRKLETGRSEASKQQKREHKRKRYASMSIEEKHDNYVKNKKPATEESREYHRTRGRKVYAQRQAEAKQRLGNCCANCGETDQRVLQFDHVDPDDKLKEVSQLYNCAPARYDDEANKTQLLCYRCHFLKTHHANKVDAEHGGVYVREDGHVTHNAADAAAPKVSKLSQTVIDHKTRIQREKQRLGGKCVACSGTDQRIMQFDYIKPGTKSSTISSMSSASDAEVTTEADKCQLLCCNCRHLKTHYPNQIDPVHGGVHIGADGRVIAQQ